MILCGLMSPEAGPTGDTPSRTVQARMQAQIDAGEVAGMVTLVASANRVLHLQAQGLADVAGGVAMKRDTIFWIASMTKPITGVAVMMMLDEGKLSVDDPIGKHIPELAHLKTADGIEHVVTIRQILTHTSGMGEMSPAESRECRTLADAVRRYAAKPLQFIPGSRWAYCQSGINTAARIVETSSGRAFPEFLDERLFRPLGTKDTTFYLGEEQSRRLAKSYARMDTGELKEAPISFLQGMPATSRDRFPAGNGGLFSTATDYSLFARMVLNGGQLNRRRYLKRETVALMTSIHTAELKTGFTPGNGWGMGWCVVREPQGVTAMLSPGSSGHGGAYGTQAWIDPKRGLAYILMVQRSNFPNSDASDLRREFQQAACENLKGR